MMRNNKSEILFAISLLTFLVLFSSMIYAPPTPHGVNGYIKYSTGVQVPLNTPYRVNVSNATDTIFFKQSKTSFPIPGQSGYYSESVSGTDGDTITVTSWNASHYGLTQKILFGTMSGFNVTINITRSPEPTVNITSPFDNTIRNDTDFFMVTSRLILYGSNATNCKAEISFSNTSILSMYNNQSMIVDLGNLIVGYSISYVWNLSGIGIGASDVTINFTCDSMFSTKFEILNYTDTLKNLTIIDTSPPNITLISPTLEEIINTPLASFNYSIIDNSAISECSLYIDGTLKQTEVLPDKSVNLSFEEPLLDGVHYWNITCNDSSPLNNFGFSETRNFTLDSTPPTIIILAPFNNTFRENNTIEFRYKTIDYGVGINNCSLFINGTKIFDDSPVFNDTEVNHTHTLTFGNYYVEVLCFDNANNYNTSDKVYFTITDPDIFISREKITFEYTSLVDGGQATVYANLTNIGNEDTLDFIVKFYYGDPELGGVQIGTDKQVNSLLKSESVSLFETFTLSRGENPIYVEVDSPIETGGNIVEANEENNNASNTIMVSSWQVYYGYKSVNILIGAGDSSIIMGWSLENSGNIIFVEEGTDFEWTSFGSLGRDVNGVVSNDDFNEADSVLNLTGFYDSIHNVYTIDDEPSFLKNITVAGIVVEDIPLSNSTNSTNFMTGIMWDKSDGGQEYDGSQDLIFLTETNHAQGMYGIYDYEAKVPASLKNYNLGSGRIMIYTELI